MISKEKVHKNLELIVAMGKNREIGYQNDLIWRMKEDLEYFKHVTMESYIIMGRNTYESMPKNLKGRRYIVLSSKPEFTLESPKIVTRSVSATLNLVESNPAQKFFIVGGQSVYFDFLPYVNKMHITEILDTFKSADTYFPEYDRSDWKEEIQDIQRKEETIPYRRLVLTRKVKDKSEI